MGGRKKSVGRSVAKSTGYDDRNGGWGTAEGSMSNALGMAGRCAQVQLHSPALQKPL